MKRDASVLLVSLFNILVLLQNECVLNAQWLLSSATKARSGSCHLSSRLICLCTPGPNGHELCIGLVEDCTNPSGTLISPSPNSFGESMISFMPIIWFIDWFYVHFWYLLLADPVETIWNTSLQTLVVSLDARIGFLGFILRHGASGNVT